MSDFILLMWKPFLACFILAGIHAYLGIHVVERKVIFVDLALAQIAALGTCLASLFHYDLHGMKAYLLSLAAALTGAIVFSLTRKRNEKIPQEAIIGITYAISAAAAILLLSQSAEGDEHIREMMVGNILLVDLPEILKMFFLYAFIGGIHYLYRKQFILISTDVQAAYQKKMPVRKWDFIFYMMFAVVVTSSVEVAGVLLVFAFLIVPSVAAILVTSDFKARLIFGWMFAIFCAFCGILISYAADFPTGASIICVFGIALLVLSILMKAVKSFL